MPGPSGPAEPPPVGEAAEPCGNRQAADAEEHAVLEAGRTAATGLRRATGDVSC